MSEEKRDSKVTLPEALRLDNYEVVGPGSVMHKGESRPAGTLIELTPKEARALGGAVRKGGTGPGPLPIGKRPAGFYIVLGPGSVCKDGKFHEPGATVELSEKDANGLDVGLKLKEAARQ